VAACATLTTDRAGIAGPEEEESMMDIRTYVKQAFRNLLKDVIHRIVDFLLGGDDDDSNSMKPERTQ